MRSCTPHRHVATLVALVATAVTLAVLPMLSRSSPEIDPATTSACDGTAPCRTAATAIISPTATITDTPGVTTTATVTVTPGITATETLTATPGVTATATITTTPGITTTATVTATPGITATATITTTPGITATGTLTATPGVTTTATLTATAGVTATTASTSTPTATAVVSPTLTPSATIAASLTTTPDASVGTTPRPSATVTPDLPPTPTPGGMASPAATPTVARTATSHAPTPAPSASPTVDVRRMRAVLPYVARGVELATRRPRVWGMQFAMEFDADQNAQDIRFELPRARSVGIGGIRTALRWDEVEPTNTTPDEFDWAAADARLGAYAAGGMDLLIMVVGYPAWATEYACGGRLRPGMDVEWREFIRAAAERYRAAPYRVAAWEIGNEVDGTLIIDNDDLSRPQGWGYAEPTTPYGGCWAGRAAEYKTFLQAAYEEIKAVAPGTPVTLGGLAYVDSFAHGLTGFDIDFLDDLLEAGGGPYFDFFNYHWFLDYPFQPPGVDRHRRAMATLARHGFPKPVWLSETYRLTVPGDRESEATQVRFLAREIIDMLAQPEIERVYWYGWVDFPPTVADQVGIPQRGLVNAGHRAKAGLSVLPHTIAHTNGVATDLSTDRAVVWRFGWPRAAETHVVAWSRDGRPARVTLAVPVGRRATVRSFPPSSVVSGKCCNERVLPVQGAQMTLDVGAESVFVEIGP